MTDSPGIDLSRFASQVFDVLGISTDAPWYVAYSGGLDSTVLLHLLWRIGKEAGARVTALHADHGLHGESDDWRRHCERQCAQWGIGSRSMRLHLNPDSGLGLEGEARRARYRWFFDVTGGRGWVFTAHHRGDQAETLIERLARGSGPRGLRGILPSGQVHGVNVARPLLETTREDIADYAARHALDWVTDASNADASLTRNYIRSQVLPVLKRRWPDIETTFLRTAAAMRDAHDVLGQTAASDLTQLDERRLRGDSSLSIDALRALAPERQRNVLRYWVDCELGVSLGLARLNHVARGIEDHPAPAAGLRWPPVELRLHRGRIYLVRDIEVPDNALTWRLDEDLVVAPGVVLHGRPANGGGLKTQSVRDGVTVRFRRGGEKCRLPGRSHRHTLKHLLQDAGIPPWQRGRIPLIMINNEVAAVAGVVCCAPYAAGPGERGIDVEVSYQTNPDLC